jgi:hypothetical protein
MLLQAMVEGAGLGKVLPEAIGPCSVQMRTGVVAVRVGDELQAAQIARCDREYCIPVL